MKRSLISLFIMLVCVLNLHSRPFCHVRHYDEYDGLSQRLVKQIVEDNNGVLWFATWNGLNRFDGYEFAKIRPRITDDVRYYSERVGDIKLTSTGDLWCRVDDKLLLFDTTTLSFSDINTKLEKKLGETILVRQILPADDGTTVIECRDKSYIILQDDDPVESAVRTSSRPDKAYHSLGNRKLGDVGPYKHNDLIYSRQTPDGMIWIITRDGKIMYASSPEGPLTLAATIDNPGGNLYYSANDRQGNLWLRSSSGAYCVNIGEEPYTALPMAKPSKLRASFRDAEGRIWVSESDNNAVAVYKPDFTSPLYLDGAGRLTDGFVQFGSPIYTFAQDSDGTIWLGGKPEGLFRLKPSGPDTFTIKHYSHDAANHYSLGNNEVYDLKFDSYGHLWISTMHGGVDFIESPTADSIRFTHLTDNPTYPIGAMRVRRINIIGDSIIVASTTGGLLTVPLSLDGKVAKGAKINLHISEPGRKESLGNVAVMDVAVDKNGTLFVATESDGVNILQSPLSATETKLDFSHLPDNVNQTSDVALSLAYDPDTGEMLTVSNNLVYTIDTEARTATTFTASSLHDRLRFTDAKPLKAGKDRWLIGTEDGAVLLDFAKMNASRYSPPVVFTAASVENRPDTLLSVMTENLILQPHERNLTLKFAALDYNFAQDIMYAYRMNDGDWSHIGKNRSVTFLDMEPGTYKLEIRSTDMAGHWLDNTRTMTIDVLPTFWETPLARFLYVTAALIIIGLTAYVIIYIRRIKRKQHETLEAYLRLLDTRNGKDKNMPGAHSPTEKSQQTVTPHPSLSPEDEAFMQRVMEFVNKSLSDPDTDVDSMAAATATSRSGLNRKMRALLGVTPAEFLKESRLSKAASLLSTSDLTVKDIALECGFADMNYFGKCFKATHNMSPTAYRKLHTSSPITE